MTHQINLGHEKWEVKVSTKLDKSKAEEIWLLFEDFFGLNKWFPGLATCYGIHGNNGEPGCIRYCEGFGLSRRQDQTCNTMASNWSKERLVSIDHVQMTLSYEIMDCNIGLSSYFSSIKVVPSNVGCKVEWCTSLDPMDGWKKEDLVGKYEIGLQLMVKKMEAFLDESSLQNLNSS